jgi:hypothetical protein
MLVRQLAVEQELCGIGVFAFVTDQGGVEIIPSQQDEQESETKNAQPQNGFEAFAGVVADAGPHRASVSASAKDFELKNGRGG